MPMDRLHRIVFASKTPAFNLNLSNLVALDIPRLAGRGWQVEELLVTTPVTPRTGIVLRASSCPLHAPNEQAPPMRQRSWSVLPSG